LVFAFGSGSDRILDYQNGQDSIDLSGIVSVTSMADLVIVETGPNCVGRRNFDGVNQIGLTLLSTAPICTRHYRSEDAAAAFAIDMTLGCWL
jgi:hypothetical protein